MDKMELSKEIYNAIIKIVLDFGASEGESATDYITAIMIGFAAATEVLTGKETDLVGFTHNLNRLAIEQLMGMEDD